ncbi:MAG: hypothetical protein ICV64_06735 [Thermoleophilia bacterium]|nr:hypothetical protein [Thermoleophilia bacterium]
MRGVRVLATVPVLALIVAAPLVEGPQGAGARGPCATEFGDGITGRPGSLDLGPDGAWWFTQQVDDQVGRLDPASGKASEIDVPPGTQPHYIRRGPGGGLWFTGLGDTIGRIDPGRGRIELFREGISDGAQLHVVLVGPDGNLWFSEQVGGRLGRLDLRSKRVTEFSERLPEGNRMHGIAVTPDGNLWTALQGSDRIARFNLASERFDRFVRFSRGSGPHDLVVAPGPVIYSSNQDNSTIGEYDLRTGRVREYATSLDPPTTRDLDPGEKLAHLVIGPDRALWIATFTANRLLRFDLETKEIEEITCGISPGSGTLGVAVGPGGRLWFTEPLGRRIARLDPE